MEKKIHVSKVAHKFRLYESKSKCRAIDSLLLTTGKMWNMGLGAIKDHYKKMGKYLNKKEVYGILSKHRKINPYWQLVNSQTMQEIVERLDASYQRFFKKIQKRSPKFKQSRYFKSLILKQYGYKLDSDVLHLKIGKEVRRFKFINSREQAYYHKNAQDRNIYNARIKRDSQSRYWVIFTVKKPKQSYKTRKKRGAIGVDFGLKTYLTVFNGKQFSLIQNPQFLKEELELLRKMSKDFSRKKRGSNNHRKSKTKLLNVYKNISNKRSDWQWKLAHSLCENFKFIGLEDLNIKAMQMMWGRKISDLAHAEFVFKLKHVANKYDTVIQEVDRFYASSKTCSKCRSKKKEFSLKDRTYHCQSCGFELDRDKNASINIRKESVRIYAQIKKTG